MAPVLHLDRLGSPEVAVAENIIVELAGYAAMVAIIWILFRR